MKSIHILLVEDNEGDIVLTTEALEDSRFINKVSVARDGEQALHLLHQGLDDPDYPQPDLILLDVNLPRKNGHEVLKSIKENPELRSIPVIMLTSSAAESDIMRSYKNRANCYITKPVEIEDFIKAIAEIKEFWIHIVKLPRH